MKNLIQEKDQSLKDNKDKSYKYISKKIVSLMATVISIVIEFCFKQDFDLDNYFNLNLPNIDSKDLYVEFQSQVNNAKIQQHNIFSIIFFSIIISSIIIIFILFYIDKINSKPKIIIQIISVIIILILCNIFSIYKATSFEIPQISKSYYNSPIPNYIEVIEYESGNKMLLKSEQSNYTSKVRNYNITTINCYICIPMILIFDIYFLFLLILKFLTLEIPIISLETLIKIIQKIDRKETYK